MLQRRSLKIEQLAISRNWWATPSLGPSLPASPLVQDDGLRRGEFAPRGLEALQPSADALSMGSNGVIWGRMGSKQGEGWDIRDRVTR